jgi:hypothetical protein
VCTVICLDGSKMNAWGVEQWRHCFCPCKLASKPLSKAYAYCSALEYRSLTSSHGTGDVGLRAVACVAEDCTTRCPSAQLETYASQTPPGSSQCRSYNYEASSSYNDICKRVNGQLMRAGTIDAVLALLERNVAHINNVNACAAFSRLAKVSPANPMCT